MKQRMQQGIVNFSLAPNLCSRGTCDETEDATFMKMGKRQKFLRFRGTCAGSEDATIIGRSLPLQLQKVQEALALKQRMQHSEHSTKYNRSEILSEALALKQRLQQRIP